MRNTALSFIALALLAFAYLLYKSVGGPVAAGATLVALAVFLWVGRRYAFGYYGDSDGGGGDGGGGGD